MEGVVCHDYSWNLTWLFLCCFGRSQKGWVGPQGIFGIIKMLSIAAQLATGAQSSYKFHLFFYSCTEFLILFFNPVSNRNLPFTSLCLSLARVLKLFFFFPIAIGTSKFVCSSKSELLKNCSIAYIFLRIEIVATLKLKLSAINNNLITFVFLIALVYPKYLPVISQSCS